MDVNIILIVTSKGYRAPQLDTSRTLLVLWTWAYASEPAPVRLIHV